MHAAGYALVVNPVGIRTAVNADVLQAAHLCHTIHGLILIWCWLVCFPGAGIAPGGLEVCTLPVRSWLANFATINGW
jgi:hypothetical protein